MYKKLLTCCAALALCTGILTAQSPKRELRSTWLTTVWGIDWPASTNETKAKSEMIECLDNLQAHNYTGVCFQVRGLADAMYKSSYEPWSSSISGTRGKDPGWDPLAFVVEECHKRGMECYAWVNPYRISSSKNPYGASQDKEWEENGWYLAGTAESGNIVFNPANAEAREHILNVIKEIYTNYAIDGMLFDDYFYPNGGLAENSSAPDYSDYEASGTNLTIGDWRRKNVNDFMKEIYDNIQIDRPDLRFGISPAGVAGTSASKYGLSKPSGVSASDWQYGTIYSDPLAWLAEGAVDFISPQLYWTTTHSTAPFGPLTTWWSDVAEKFGRHFYASHSISFLQNDNSESNWADVAKQVNLHREGCENDAPGAIYYSTKYLDGMKGAVSGLGNYLEGNVYQGKSLVPRITWKERPTYPAPASLSRSNEALTWEAAKKEGNAIIRYSVYAIPTSVMIDRAMASNGDGIDGQYILGVSYDTKYEIPSDKRIGYYYAVCVYDGYGYESEPSFADYNVDPSTPTTIIYPKNGETVEWAATFKWNEVAQASYFVEISDNVDFSPVIFNSETTTKTFIDLDLSKLKSETKYYWRVITTEPSKGGVASSIESFTTTTREVGNYEEGYTIVTDPDEYNSTDYSLTSLWMRSAKESFENFPVAVNGSLNRGMIATKDYVYVSGRSDASSSAALYLQAYNAKNGEHEFDLTLGTNGQCSYLPCNDVIKDSENNVYISNLVLNSSNTSVMIHLVDLTNGNLTEVASLLTPVKSRIDHVGIYGDATSGNFKVFAAAASEAKVYRWTIEDGKAGDPETMTTKDFYPSSAGSFGIAPRVKPISENLFYLDGGSTSTILYDFTTGMIVDKPSDGSALATTAYAANGHTRFNLGKDNFLLYAATDDKNGYSYNIVKSSSENILGEGSLLFNAPKSTLGTVNSTTTSSPTDVVVLSDKEARIYMYSPGNGIAAYLLSNTNSLGVREIIEIPNRMTIYSNVVTFERNEAFIKAYNFAGMLVATAKDSDELALPSSGTYIIVTPSSATKVVIR